MTEQSPIEKKESNDYYIVPEANKDLKERELKEKESKDKMGNDKKKDTAHLSTANNTTGGGGGGHGHRKKNKHKKKKKKVKREKMKDGELVKSETFLWKVIKLLGSGGFGDVYKVSKIENLDKKEYAMKTEMVEGDKRLLRLKIEVSVLKQCHDCPDESRRKTFVEFVDRGITEKFKFLVMGLVGPSLEDIRKEYLFRNYSRPTAMNAIIQTLKAVSNLHFIGWLHRDIKPANYAVGIGKKEDVIYMLDFGIARKIFKDDTKEVKPTRTRVKFLGTLRFAARACHHEMEQGRKDDLETWLYMAFDLLDEDHGLPWKRTGDKKSVVLMKEKFFVHSFPKIYKIIPKEFRKLVDYINGLSISHEPDYLYMEHAITAICHDYAIDLSKKLDWIGKLKKKPETNSSSSGTSSDNRQSGSESSDSDKKKKATHRKKHSAEAKKSKEAPKNKK